MKEYQMDFVNLWEIYLSCEYVEKILLQKVSGLLKLKREEGKTKFLEWIRSVS